MQQLSSNTSTSLNTASSILPTNANETVTSNEADQLETPLLHGGDSNRPIHPVISNIPGTPVETPRPQLGEDTSAGNSRVWNDFKLVGDNIDKNYHQSFHCIDKKTTSIHYFHYYIVSERIDLSGVQKLYLLNRLMQQSL